MDQLGLSLIVGLLFILCLLVARLLYKLDDSTIERKKGNKILTNLLTLLKSNISKELDGLSSTVEEMLSKIKNFE